MPEFENKEYDADNKRLFYWYRVGIDELMPTSVGGIPNMERFKLAQHALDKIIPTYNDTPAVLKPRLNANPIEMKTFQIGNFVHPIPMPLVKNGSTVPPSIHDWRQYNENYAVGRVRTFKNSMGEWRFRIEITDPKTKEHLLANENSDLVPRYISAQLFVKPPFTQDFQNITNAEGSHVAFTDRPAGGFERMDILKKCYDNEANCQIKLMNASQTGKCGYCPGEAIDMLIKSCSSHLGKNEDSTHIMSMNPSSTGPQGDSGQRVERIIKDPNYLAKKQQGSTTQPTGVKPEEDEETKKLRTELEEIRRHRQDQNNEGKTEVDKMKQEMRDEILALKKDKAKVRIDKFMDKAKPIFKTRKAFEDAVNDMLEKLPYDDNERLFQRLAELDEVWSARADSMMIRAKSASLQTGDSMRSVPQMGSSSSSVGMADICFSIVNGMKKGIN